MGPKAQLENYVGQKLSDGRMSDGHEIADTWTASRGTYRSDPLTILAKCLTVPIMNIPTSTSHWVTAGSSLYSSPA